MDKTFEEIISETLEELNVDTNNDTSEEIETEETEVEESENEEIDENIDNETEESEEEIEDDEEVEDEVEESEEDVEEEEVVSPGANTKDAEAFARMRKENKGMKDIIDFFDTKAKEMGLQDVNDLIAKTNEAELARKAKEQGIPLEYAKRLQELEAKVELQEQEKQEQIAMANEARVKNTLDSFVQANGLDDKSVNKLAKDLIEDGVTLEFFENMPDKTISKILKSYLPSNFDKQKDLEKKEKFKKEAPVDIKTTTSTTTQDDKITEIAKGLLEKY